MKINIKKFREQEIANERVEDTLSFEQKPEQVSDFRFAEPVNVIAEIEKQEDAILVTGSVSARLSVVCDRCGEEFEFTLKNNFTTLFTGGPGIAGYGECDEIEDGEIENRDISADEIDLTDDICQCIILGMPMKLLCVPDCKGLCVDCGENLNNSSCECSKQKYNKVGGK